MLISTTFHAIMREALDKAATLTAHRLDIAKFEELCAVLRQQGNAFTESLQVGVDEIDYAIVPDNHGDYLAIAEALAAMGAHRKIDPDMHMRDIINPQPDAPVFFLSVPFIN